jgi:hypothetical protein
LRSRDRYIHAVTQATHANHVSRCARIIAQSPTQQLHALSYGLGVYHRRSPDALEQLVCGQHARVGLRQGQEQFEGQIRQRDLDTLACHSMSADIDAQISSLVDLSKSLDGGIQDGQPRRIPMRASFTVS